MPETEQKPAQLSTPDGVKDVPLPEVRERLIKSLRSISDPDSIVAEAKASGLFERNPQTDKEKKDVEEIVLTFGFENDHVLMRTVSEKYRGLAIQMRRQLIRDFDCKTYAEKILVDAMVNAYIRTLESSEKLAVAYNADDVNKLRTDYMAVISKELDRSHRHLLAAFQTMAQLKRPGPNVTIKAKNAFVAQAQQFNAQSEPNDT